MQTQALQSLAGAPLDGAAAPGFEDPVHDAQRVFRGVLEAMAHPGRVTRAGALTEAPALLHPATAALFLALADLDTPVWLQPQANQDAGTTADHDAGPSAGLAGGDALASWLRFHCGCPIAAQPAAAAFALVHTPLVMPPLAAFRLGDPEYPDRSTTLLIQIEGFAAAAGGVTLSGPGIRDSQSFAPAGLPAGFWNEWRENAQLFPRGVDVIFVAGHDLAALPRTTLVRA
jgi:alpha-D-ribose 1-methylphosphonate 5-triphosphate synthase subunit PhnH